MRDDNSVISFEASRLMGLHGDVPDEDYLVPLGRADIKRACSDAEEVMPTVRRFA